MYFLVSGLLQTIKEISTSDGRPLVFIPLSFVLTVSAIKDIIEDYKRHKSDREENSREYLVLREGQFVKTESKNIMVGDIVKVLEKQYIPADMLLIKTTGKKGAAYVETKNLDGETSLKYKNVHVDILKYFDTEDKVKNANQKFKLEGANVFLYKFVGTLNTENDTWIPLSEPNFLLRGSSLQNTDEIIGIVGYTGHDTKIMMNSIRAKSKFSKVEKLLNKILVAVICLQIIICLISGLAAAIWIESHKDNTPYLRLNAPGSEYKDFHYNFFARFGNWLLLFTNFVPISLIVTLEMIHIGQVIYMYIDREMVSKSGFKTVVQSSNLNDELGQVTHIFSDKTGTITQNIMEFKSLSIKNKTYGEKKDIEDLSKYPEVTNVDFRDSSIFKDLDDNQFKYYDDLKESMILLASCHSIIVEEKNGKLKYNASSPDELALLNFARFCGITYLGLDENNQFELNFRGETIRFKLLHILEFNSDRKRMSVILRNTDGKIILYTKGADSVIYDRLKNPNDPEVYNTHQHVNDYATDGLRTLLLAKRIIEEEDYAQWANQYAQVSSQIEDREVVMMEHQSKIEVNLELLGATAIEDKLQDDVGHCLSKFREADIKVWMLTGDKVETAINIGYSCHLLQKHMTLLRVLEKTEKEVGASLSKHLETIKNGQDPSETYALVISGEAAHEAVKSDLAPNFIKLSDSCKSVIACRVTPKQKQELVTLTKTHKPKVRTLAIGDGANDVNMIIAAHVGIGIKGLEGQQAARASDFSIGEFRILKRLLFFYGRENYRRSSTVALFSLYKNMLVAFSRFLFAFYSGFSGANPYDEFIFQGLNIFFTSVPIIIFGIFDNEYKPEKLQDSPSLYEQGQKDRCFNFKKLGQWYTMGIYESIILFFSAIYGFDHLKTIDNDDGRLFFHWGFGMMIFTNAVLIVNLKTISISNEFNGFNTFFIFGSVLFYILSFYVLNLFSFVDVYGYFNAYWSTPTFYMIAIVVCSASFFVTTAVLRYSKLVELKKLADEKCLKQVHFEDQTPQVKAKEVGAGNVDQKQDSVGDEGIPNKIFLDKSQRSFTKERDSVENFTARAK